MFLKANIHSFLESDDRLALLMKCMDEAISEIDNMESLISTYKIHLNVRNPLRIYACSPHFPSRQSTTIFFISNPRTRDYKYKHRIKEHSWENCKIL